MHPVCIGIYGDSDSGKTVLLTRLVQDLTNEGYTIATIKQTDQSLSLDEKGKDTWRHAQAGAQVVVFSSTIETTIFIKKFQTTQQILDQLNYIGTFDFIFIEGATDPTIPKIRIGSRKERPKTLWTFHNNYETILNSMKTMQPLKKEQIISLRVNNKPVPLTDFPAHFLVNTIEGMVKSLKGVTTIKEIEIKIKR